MMKERLGNLKFRNKRYKVSYAADVNKTFLSCGNQTPFGQGDISRMSLSDGSSHKTSILLKLLYLIHFTMLKFMCV